MSTQVLLGLMPQVAVQHEHGELVLRSHFGTLRFLQPSSELETMVAALADAETTEDELLDSQNFEQMCMKSQLLHRLEGMVTRRICSGSTEFLSLSPTSVQPGIISSKLSIDRSTIKMSRFAFSRLDHEKLVLESPRSEHRAVVGHEGICQLLFALRHPCHPRQLMNETWAEPKVILEVLELLVRSRLVVLDSDREERDDALRLWEFHDLLFHTWSHLGRHDHAFGADFRLKDEIKAWPALQTRTGPTAIPLAVPDLASEKALLADILERRRSIRTPGPKPLTLLELGHFLYRTARVRSEETVDYGEGRIYELATRPYPNSGACYELEIYLAAQRCDGLVAGFYHYNPADHRLVFLHDDPNQLADVLAIASMASQASSPPDVLLLITSRIPRLSWKYSSLAYALTLKNVGVLTQTFYLMATAMKLAPCALGSSNEKLIGKALGLDRYQEVAVGDFMLSSGNADEDAG